MTTTRRATIALILTFIFAILLCPAVFADEGGTGNEWVYDEPQVVTDETEAYIKNLNETVFTSYKNKPQLAIVIINDLPYSIDNYKRDLFNEFGVGTAEENCGMLFLFAINDREYALEIGDGFKKGSLLRQDLETDFITEDMKNSLRAGDYDSVVLQVAQYLEGVMADEENGIYDQAEAEKLAAQKLLEEQIIAQAAKMEAIINRIFVIGAIILIALCLISFAVALIKKHLCKKKIQALCSSYSKHLHVAGTTEKEFTAFLKERYSSISNAELEEQFLNLLHEHYLTRQTSLLYTSIVNKERLSLYEMALKDTNNIQAFMRCQITSLDMIIYQVDEAERKKDEMRCRNAGIIDQFLQANKHRIVHKSTYKAIRASLYKHQYHDKLVTQDILEKAFVAALNDLNFRWEVDRFIREHSDQTGQYFNRDVFYTELLQSENYRNYHYNRYYDSSWMYPLLIMHMANGKKAHQEKIEQERRQHQAEERRRQKESIQSSNSSFSTSFGGGSSSGGGFKGGW